MVKYLKGYSIIQNDFSTKNQIGKIISKPIETLITMANVNVQLNKLSDVGLV